MDKGKVKIAVLGFSTLLLGATIITGIVADIAGHFPDAGKPVVNLVLTLPFLVATLFALLAGPLCKYIAKKKLVIICHVAVLAGGILAYLFGEMSITVLLAVSVLLGVSQGALSTISMALIADHFEGHERGALMGLQSTFVTFGGMIIAFVGAMLAGIHWNTSYLVLLVALPSLIVVLKCLPMDAPEIQSAARNADQGGGMTGAAFFYAGTGAAYGVFMFILQANLAFYIARNGLGGADTAGYANTTIVAAGGVTGILYGRLSQILKRFVLPVGLIASAVGFLLMFSVGNLVAVFIACACIGFGLTATVPTIMYNASVAVPPASATMAIALINTGTNVGMFTSPFIIGFIMKWTGNTDIKAQFLTGAVGMVALAIIYILADGAISRSKTAPATPNAPVSEEA